jgi:hypothetical protein
MTSAAPDPRRQPIPRLETLKSRPPYLRASSSLRTSSSTSSLSSLFGKASLGTQKRAGEDSKSLICRAFVPHIAVHVSHDTNELAREKGFASFQEMLRPYGEDLLGRLTVRDSQGSSNSYDDFGVRFVGLAEVAASGERWETGMSHANGHGEKAEGTTEKVYLGGNIEEIEELINLHLERNEETEDAPTDQSFYLLYLRKLLSALPVSPHETFSHPVACVIAISSRNPSPIETLRNLYTSGTKVPLPQYVNPDYLRYYVLVHDEDRDDITKSVIIPWNASGAR